jgi:transketolase C-terminal domain/subunit
MNVAIHRVETLMSFLGHRDAIQSESEDTVLLREIDEFNRTDPDWDHPGRVVGAEQMLRDGSDMSLVIRAYGQQIAFEAAQNLHASNRPAGAYSTYTPTPSSRAE